ncbi:hypothetical protein TSUD_110300 [Trifolium subterraneum]|uniref:Uncharacterized protein n=1 Tax=Trifolium subterraneum TaxID=3900 RepID=A0A2Z6LJ16_TRISU|nr:hypothetical protein TSUD_110300 [Trifolium subterraneum]
MLSPSTFLQDFCVPDTVNPVTNGSELEDSSSSPSSVTSSNGESTKGTRYSNYILGYISDILMDEEDDLELKPCMLQECLRLQAAEKSFYDVLGHNYPNSSCEDSTDTDGNVGRTASFESNSSSCSTDNSYESDWVNHVAEFDHSSSQLQTPVVEKNYYNVTEAANNIHNGSWNAIQPGMGEEFSASVVPREKRSHKMKCDDTCNEQEGRGTKLSAIFSDELEPPEILDEVLLCQSGRTQNQQASQNVNSAGKAKGTAVDLWTMLTQCAQAVASYDQRNTNELLKQIRQHSSPFGDGLQRLAYYFADGLEIRLAAETPSYKPLDLATAGDMLKAYKLFITSSPLQRMTNMLLTKTIFRLVKNEGSIHIIDFGICYVDEDGKWVLHGWKGRVLNALSAWVPT